MEAANFIEVIFVSFSWSPIFYHHIHHLCNPQVVSPNEIKKLHPHINVLDIEGGVWVPDDCIANPQAIGSALASLAEKGGARYAFISFVQDICF